MMKILMISATPFEIEPTRKYLQQHFNNLGEERFQKGNVEIKFLITGVGLTLTTYAITKAIQQDEYNLLINAGIAGALNPELKIGAVVQVISEEFADLGVEAADGNFISVMEMGLIEANQPPFKKGKLQNTAADAFSFLPKARGISVNKVHGSEGSILSLKQKYQADIESMEGAAFFYVALKEGLPFLQIRSISNYVEPRNKDNWNIPIAIENLNKVILEIIGFFTAEALL